VMCDEIFGYENFLNEVIWSYNFGGRGKDRWPMKHDTILVYVKKMGKHIFNWDDIDRIPYAAPELQYVGRSKEEAEKRIAQGQVPTDVWSMSIVGTASKERIGYPNQKPIKLMRRAIAASSPIGGTILDPFAGSGSTGAAAMSCGRNFILADASQQAVDVMKKRFDAHI
jgi:site-specific DNA-methyltransferase (adenine-specific)